MKVWFGIVASLAIMAVAMFTSLKNEASTYDETAHLAAGISYIEQQQYLLNPEHPPLFKLLAGSFAIAKVKPIFPTNTDLWQKKINQQFELGQLLIYQSGYSADALMFWGRFPMVLLTLLFGLCLAWWSKRQFGAPTALVSTLLFALSPTLIAHGRYITNDMFAAFGLFVGLVSFIWYLKSPSYLRALLVGGALAFAELSKFSLLLLLPTVAIALVIHLFITYAKGERLRQFWHQLGHVLVAMVIMIVLIDAVYGIVMKNEPVSRQQQDTAHIVQALNTGHGQLLQTLDSHTLTRPLGKYLVGVLMASRRAEFGGEVYLTGEDYSGGKVKYFPTIYFAKETLPVILLTFGLFITALIYGLANKIWVKSFWNNYTTVWILGLTILLYWLLALVSGLNIGIRHLLPILPLTMVLTARLTIVFYLKAKQSNWWQSKTLGVTKLSALGALGMVLLLWQLVEVLIIAPPYYISYYNELFGGIQNGHQVAVDSNYDWGQDLKRLSQLVTTLNIPRINVNYFGSALPQYYLGNRYIEWQPSEGIQPGWYAISVSYLEYFWHNSDDKGYNYFKDKQPVAKAGTSIYIYHVQ